MSGDYRIRSSLLHLVRDAAQTEDRKRSAPTRPVAPASAWQAGPTSPGTSSLVRVRRAPVVPLSARSVLAEQAPSVVAAEVATLMGHAASGNPDLAASAMTAVGAYAGEKVRTEPDAALFAQTVFGHSSMQTPSALHYAAVTQAVATAPLAPELRTALALAVEDVDVLDEADLEPPPDHRLAALQIAASGVLGVPGVDGAPLLDFLAAGPRPRQLAAAGAATLSPDRIEALGVARARALGTAMAETAAPGASASIYHRLGQALRMTAYPAAPQEALNALRAGGPGGISGMPTSAGGDTEFAEAFLAGALGAHDFADLRATAKRAGRGVAQAQVSALAHALAVAAHARVERWQPETSQDTDRVGAHTFALIRLFEGAGQLSGADVDFGPLDALSRLEPYAESLRPELWAHAQAEGWDLDGLAKRMSTRFLDKPAPGASSQGAMAWGERLDANPAAGLRALADAIAEDPSFLPRHQVPDLLEWLAASEVPVGDRGVADVLDAVFAEDPGAWFAIDDPSLRDEVVRVMTHHHPGRSFVSVLRNYAEQPLAEHSDGWRKNLAMDVEVIARDALVARRALVGAGVGWPGHARLSLSAPLGAASPRTLSLSPRQAAQVGAQVLDEAAALAEDFVDAAFRGTHFGGPDLSTFTGQLLGSAEAASEVAELTVAFGETDRSMLLHRARTMGPTALVGLVNAAYRVGDLSLAHAAENQRLLAGVPPEQFLIHGGPGLSGRVRRYARVGRRTDVGELSG